MSNTDCQEILWDGGSSSDPTIPRGSIQKAPRVGWGGRVPADRACLISGVAAAPLVAKRTDAPKRAPVDYKGGRVHIPRISAENLFKHTEIRDMLERIAGRGLRDPSEAHGRMWLKLVELSPITKPGAVLVAVNARKASMRDTEIRSPDPVEIYDTAVSMWYYPPSFQEIVASRHAARLAGFEFLANWAGYSTREIGRALGLVHTTVVRRIEKQRKQLTQEVWR